MPLYITSGSFGIGATETEPFKLNEKVLCGIIITASTVTGSLVSFFGSVDGTNFYPVFDSLSAEVNLTVSASPGAFSLDAESFLSYLYIKGRLGTSASSVMQKTYDTPIVWVTRDL